MTDPPPETWLPGTVARAAGGDAAAWRALVEAYSGRVYGLMVHHCGDRDLAEELTQAAFVKVFEKLGDPAGTGGGGYEEQGRFEAWLFRIAMNKLRDEMRRRRRHATPTDLGPGGIATAGLTGGDDAGGFGEDPAAVVDRAEDVQRLRDAVAQLPEADREVLTLRHTAGLSFKQIAEALDQPLGTVLARAHRALGKLRKLMGDVQ